MEPKFGSYSSDKDVRKPPPTERRMLKTPRQMNGTEFVRARLSDLIHDARGLRGTKGSDTQVIEAMEEEAVVLQDGLNALRDGEMPSLEFMSAVNALERQAALDVERMYEANEKHQSAFSNSDLRDALARLQALADFRTQFAPSYRESGSVSASGSEQVA
jgi:hypothetical protein